MKTDQFNYNLPPELIAQEPHDPVDQCRLMVVDRHTWSCTHQQFDTALIHHLSSKDILFFNNSKVIKARIVLGDWEILYLWPSNTPSQYEFLVRPWSKFKTGRVITIDNESLLVVAHSSHGRILQYDGDIHELLNRYGQLPLPPYITYESSKESHYQPVVATLPWSVASPTASLHFTQGLLDSLNGQWVMVDYVTLHVGMGTFRHIDSPTIEDYRIHSEQCQVDIALFQRIMNYKLQKENIVAVGTTSCRTLESLPYLYPLIRSSLVWHLSDKELSYRDQLSSNNTKKEYITHPTIVWQSIFFTCQLYITPWFSFRIIDQLITNFHLPKSSLMVLVATFMGYENMMNCYQEAIKKNYMFYSFWDALWIR